jgi:hypothetical protein
MGLLLLVVGFCGGVDTPTSATVAGHSHDCADVIPTGLLVSGLATSEDTGADTRTPAERRLDARVTSACKPLDQRARWAVWTGIGLGALLLLGGWTVVRERELDEATPARRTDPVGV